MPVLKPVTHKDYGIYLDVKSPGTGNFDPKARNLAIPVPVMCDDIREKKEQLLPEPLLGWNAPDTDTTGI
jgi:hypothetical protein